MLQPQTCLVDSGALHNRFGRVLADVAGIDLSDGERERFGVGGFLTEAATVPVRLQLGEAVWQAPVSFCDPWPLDFQILGQEGFLRFFRTTLCAAEGWVECTFES
ncbi:MAG: hypothetical protein GEU81_01060 [Nitriliruptorales bacterium]|nr:hypothetical protein [Nitriliruptorales bacterium]